MTLHDSTEKSKQFVLLMTALRTRDSLQNILLQPRHRPLGKETDSSAATPFVKRFPTFFITTDGNRASIMLCSI